MRRDWHYNPRLRLLSSDGSESATRSCRARTSHLLVLPPDPPVPLLTTHRAPSGGDPCSARAREPDGDANTGTEGRRPETSDPLSDPVRIAAVAECEAVCEQT